MSHTHAIIGAGTIWPCKLTLTARRSLSYSSHIGETTPIQRRKLEICEADNRAKRFFYVRTPLRADFNGGPGGAAFGLAGCLHFRFSTPAVWPATPHVEMSGGSSLKMEAAMAVIPARPEQAESPIQIINRALRDAALAPTVFDALDCCADALLQLAEIARAEVRHG